MCAVYLLNAFQHLTPHSHTLSAGAGYGMVGRVKLLLAANANTAQLTSRSLLQVILFGVVFSLVTSALVWLEIRFGGLNQTSEQFNTAGRTVKTGLIANVIVSQWTWAATLLQRRERALNSAGWMQSAHTHSLSHTPSSNALPAAPMLPGSMASQDPSGMPLVLPSRSSCSASSRLRSSARWVDLAPNCTMQ
jgi:hypothetical protein